MRPRAKTIGLTAGGFLLVNRIREGNRMSFPAKKGASFFFGAIPCI
jgi:hypothetical protein